MITVHSLEYSRALRVVWLLEEIGQHYELKNYKRTEAYRAPPELKALHPLGKSPLIVEGDLVLAESAAILRYIDERHAGGRFRPEPGTDDHARHDEWLDSVEGVFARSVIAAFWARKNGAAMEQRMQDEFAANMAYLSHTLDGRSYLTGERLMLADIQMSYLLAMAERCGMLAEHPRVADYLHRLQDQPALKRAIEKAGPMVPENL